MTQTGLSIIVPVYNEEDGLKQTIEELESVLGHGPVELILVNDGSRPETVAVLNQIDLDRVTILHHKSNRGYGSALKTGMQHAKFDTVAITDADGTYPNEKIPEFYQAIQKNNLDMVVGARIGERVHIPMIRRIPKWFIGKLANYVADFEIPDLNSGLRVMRKNIVERYLSILPDGFSFTSTITLAMLVNGHNVEYKAIDYFKRKGKSKIRPIHDTLNFLKLILRTTIFFDPLRVFIPLGLLLFLAAGLAAGFGFFILEKIPDVTVAIFALGGIQMIALGLVADLINRKFSSHM